MKIGWCGRLENAEIMKRVGLDYIEIPIAPLNIEDDEDFKAAKAAIASSPLATTASNTFFARDIRVVGPEIDERRVKSYIARAAEICATAKSNVVVLGSGWARNVPEHWERSRAEDQFVETLSWCADALKGTGTTLVIEPLNRKESNLINSVDEGVRFAKRVDRPEIRVLADFYHMDEEHEPLETLKRNIEWLSHIHLADTGRRNPGTGSYPYDEFFGNLKQAGYKGMISAECSVVDPEADMRRSLQFLRRYWE